MTDTLRKARIAEAKRRTGPCGKGWEADAAWNHAFAHHLIDLYESDWRPEPEVDAVTLAAREWLKVYTALNNSMVDAGTFDSGDCAQAFRAGHAHALANHPDVKRMDWLEECATVQFQPLNDRASDFWSRGFGSPLRTKIDRAMRGE